MLNGEGKENGEKINNRSNWQESNFALAAHFFAVVLHDYNVKLPETFMEEMSYVFLFTLFFSRRSFSPQWPQAFLIFAPPLQNFMLFLQQKNVSFVFSLSL